MTETSREFEYQGMALYGAPGKVGRRLVERVTESDYPEGEHFHNDDLRADKNPIPNQHPTKIIAIADSTHFYVDIQGVAAEVLRKTEDTRQNIKDLLAEKGTPHNGDLMLVVQEIRSQIKALGADSPLQEAHVGHVDLTDSIDMKPVYENVLGESEGAIIAVSKEVLGAATKDEFDTFVNTGRLEFRPTVGAGSDAVSHCLDVAESRERLIEIAAMISGTNLGICKGLDSEEYRHGEIELSGLLEREWKAKNTEPLIDKDVGEENTDTYNKARILAMAAGLEALPENIKAGMPFVPKEFRARFPEPKQALEYLGAVATEIDAKMRSYVLSNTDKHYTLRHIARIRFDQFGNEQISIGLEQVRRDSEFGLSDQNVVIITDDTEEIILKKPGAGRDVTSKSIEQAFRRLVPRGLPRKKTG